MVRSGIFFSIFFSYFFALLKTMAGVESWKKWRVGMKKTKMYEMAKMVELARVHFGTTAITYPNTISLCHFQLWYV
jgi:hypothetical protein